MDYTPGAMINLESENFNPMFTRPASQGTRVHQMALYAIFESPLQMMADNPSNYMKEQECTSFICAIPTTWDETVVLAGKVGEYIAVARRNGDTWYLGALAGTEARELTFDAGFLGSGDYIATIFSDGINADRNVSDYSRSEETFAADKVFTIKMAPGGGWVARIEVKK